MDGENLAPVFFSYGILIIGRYAPARPKRKRGKHMLTQEATPALIKQWKAVFNEHHDKLRPNRKSGQELLDYLRGRYPLCERHDTAALEVVSENVLNNEPLREKLKPGKAPAPIAFTLPREGSALSLYAQQDPLFWGIDIFVGIDLESGFFHVEGSSLLWDELYAFRGLDERDIENYYCVAEYIACLERFPQPPEA